MPPIDAQPTSPVSEADSPVDAALRLMSSAERVSTKELPEGGISIEVGPGPRNVWKVPVLFTVLGAVGVAAGYLLHIYNPGLPEGYVWRAPWKLMGMAAIVMAMGPVGLLINIMQGPPKKATLEARPGSLRAERSIAGDRVVSSYGAGEVECLFVDDAALFATTRKGDQHLLAFGNAQLKKAIATVLASRLWQGEETAAVDVKGLARWVILTRARLDKSDAGAAPRR